MPDDEMSDAREKGRASGYRQDGGAHDCPFGFDAYDLRREWFIGFGEGRARRYEENSRAADGGNLSGSDLEANGH